jgi:protein ImuB
MTRIACLHVPLFPLAARLRAEPELAGEAVVVCRGNGSAARVVAASRLARQTGVRPGMSLAQARSMLPALIARGPDPVCERSAHEALLEVAWSLSPAVEDDDDDVVYADVGGMEKLYPGASGEREMGQVVVVAGEALDLLIRVGVAANKLAARVAARLPDSPTVVPLGEEGRFLAPLPLGHLGLDRRLSATLHRWGIATAGELARLPADRVASRLGEAGAAAHRAARGEDPRPLVPRQPPPTLSEGMELEWPVVTVDPLIAAVGQSLGRIRLRLERQDLACTQLELELGLEPEGADHRIVRLPAPTRDVDALLALIRLELAARPPRAPVAAFLCAAHPDRPRRGQLSLFGAPEIHPDKLAATLARLAARLGPDRVGSPRTVDGHLPERYASASFDPPPPPKLRQEFRQGRGLLMVRVLRPPVALEVITEERGKADGERGKAPTHPNGTRMNTDGHGSHRSPAHPGASTNPPRMQRVEHELRNAEYERRGLEHECQVAEPPSDFRLSPSDFNSLRLISVASITGATPRIQGLVRVAAGPWSLEDGWWRAEPVERDYWDVELSGGGLYRIFRERRSGDWFADGMYD